MRIAANSVDEYLLNSNPAHQPALIQLRKIISENIPAGFQEELSCGMIGWVIPHSLYPLGYHCDPKLPLPFCSIASQKNFVGFYQMVFTLSPNCTINSLPNIRALASPNPIWARVAFA